MKNLPSIYLVAAAVGVGIWYIHKQATATAALLAAPQQMTAGQFAGQTMTERRLQQFANMRSASAAERPYRTV